MAGDTLTCGGAAEARGKRGCTDPRAANFDPAAAREDMSCRYPGCTDPDAENFSAAANEDDGSCVIHRCADCGSLRSRRVRRPRVLSLWTYLVPEHICLLEIPNGSKLSEPDKSKRSVEVCRAVARLSDTFARGAVPKIAQGWPRLWANFRALTGIFSQSAGPSLASRANPVRSSSRSCEDALASLSDSIDAVCCPRGGCGGGAPTDCSPRCAQVRKTPSWPRSWANFSLF